MNCHTQLEEEIEYHLEVKMDDTFPVWFDANFVGADYDTVVNQLIETLVRDNNYFQAEEMAYQQSVAGIIDGVLQEMIDGYVPTGEPPIVPPIIELPPPEGATPFLTHAVKNGMNQVLDGEILRNKVLRHVVEEILLMDHETLSNLVG